MKDLLYNIDLHCKQTMASALKFNRNNEISGMIVGIVYKYIQKKYNLKIFEERPELANSLLRKYEEKKSRRELAANHKQTDRGTGCGTNWKL